MKLHMVTMLAQFESSTTIARELEKTYGTKISKQLVQRYKDSPRWASMIKRVREKYTSDVASVAGYWKRVRMDRLERMYSYSERKNDIPTCLKIIEAERIEAEGTAKDSVVNYIHNELTIMSDKELEQRRLQIIERLNRLNIAPKGDTNAPD